MFLRYTAIGLANTLIHWLVFFLLLRLIDSGQSLANLGGFLVAASFSFFVNARLTFKKRASGTRYFAFIVFLGALSYLTGHIAQTLAWPPLITLVLFSSTSLVLGFFYSKFIVFGGTGT